MTGGKRTIGVVLGALTDLFQTHVWPGIIDTARERDAGVILYSGKIPETPFLAKRELGVVYGFPSTRRIDGIVLFSSVLFNFVTDEEFLQSISRYGDIPLISLARAAPGRPSIVIDSRSGTLALMRHFIGDHGYRRIAFIRGPEGSKEAEERFGAYRDALEEAGIPYDPRLVVQGFFLPQGGIQAAKCLVEERKVRFDALVAANDGSLLGALGYLRSRWILIPGDVGAAGFDDVDEARFHIPPLTTVSQSLYTMGRTACANLLDLLDGKKIPPLVTLPTRLVIRRSCGCANPQDTAPGGVEGKPPKGFEADGALPLRYRRQADDFARALESELRGKPVRPAFLERVAAILDNGTLDYTEREALRKNLDALSAWVSGLKGNARKKGIMALDSARSLLLEYLGRSGNWNKLPNQVSFMQEVSKALPTAISIEGIFAVMEKSLEELDINFCLIAFPEGECAVKGIFADPPERSRLAFAWSEGRRIELPPEGIPFESRNLAPEEFAPQRGKGVLVTFPLIYNEDYLGFMVCDYPSTSAVTVSLEFLHEQLSASIQTTRMFEDLKRAQTRLLHTEKMASLGELTAGIAHELKNPLNFVNNFADGIVEYAEDLQRILNKGDDSESATGSPLTGPASGSNGLRAAVDSENPLHSECKAILDDLKTAAESISRHGKKADRIIRSMLNQAKGDTDRLEKTQINTLLRDAAVLAWQSFKIQYPDIPVKIEERYDENLAEIYANPSQLNRVFINLLSNALYALRMKVSNNRRTGTNAVYRPMLSIKTEGTLTGVRVEITDNGTGISEEILPLIFQPFFTTKPNNEGTGLGLKICRDIVVDGHGGTIEAASQEGEQTTFTVFLPKQLQPT